jgi:hypothetical protein
VIDAETESLEMFELNSATRAAVAKAARQSQERKLRQQALAAPSRQEAGPPI